MNDTPIMELSKRDSWSLLAERSLGRLVTAPLGRPEIFPVNYIVAGESIIFRTAEGTKLVSVVLDENVAFEVDEVFDDGAVCVIARGRARLVDESAETQELDLQRLRSWVPTLKYNVVAIEIDELSGRRFTFGDEPDRYPAL